METVVFNTMFLIVIHLLLLLVATMAPILLFDTILLAATALKMTTHEEKDGTITVKINEDKV